MISEAVERSRIEYSMRNCPTTILEPQEVIRKAIEQHGDRCCVSCSFGACSVVVLHMALQQKPDLKVVFCDTGVEYPETYAYRDLLREKWSLNLIEAKPKRTFWSCVDEYGFPLIRHAIRKGKRIEKSQKPQCCIHLKELPMKEVCKEHGVTATLTGLRCGESSVRMFTLAQRGQYYQTTKWGKLWRYHPIGFWNYQQTHGYLEEHNIPMNAIYKKAARSGCMPCTGFLNWEKQLSKTNLKMYRWVQKLRKVPLMDDFLQLEDQALCDAKDDDSMAILQD